MNKKHTTLHQICIMKLSSCPSTRCISLSLSFSLSLSLSVSLLSYFNFDLTGLLPDWKRIICYSTSGFLADLHNCGIESSDGKAGGKKLHLPSFSDSSIAIILCRSICIPSIRVDNCCHHCFASEDYNTVDHQSICRGHSTWLQWGVWHCQTCHLDGKVLDAGPWWLCLQLAQQFLHRSWTLHHLQWYHITILGINSSVIQGSGIGPASYSVNASDLRPCTDGNDIVKFADDFDLVIPASNIDSRSAELRHVEVWSVANNLRLNRNKSQEIIFYRPHTRKNKIPQVPEIPGIPRVKSITTLGVVLADSFSMEEHITSVISSSARALYALRILKQHGMNRADLQKVFQSTVISRLQYASPAWWGFTTAAQRDRLRHFSGKV